MPRHAAPRRPPLSRLPRHPPRRIDAQGREVHDVMPWEGAVGYATDGERLGIQYADGQVVWLGRAQDAALGEPDGDGAPPPYDAASFREDFEGVNLDALVEGMRSYMDLHPVLKTVWREDLAALDELRGRRPPGVEG